MEELEKRINHLENIVRYSDIMKQKPKQTEALKGEVTVEKEEVEKKEAKKEPEVDAQPANTETTFAQDNRESKSTLSSSVDQKENSKQYEHLNKNRASEVPASTNGEAFVGKYIIGISAAVLIFIGTIFFVGLIWDYMSDGVKLSIISLVGISVSVIGFRLVRTKKNVISSIILGTGAGLVFIAILSANLAFNLIGNNVSIILVALWAVIFMLSYRYTHTFISK